MRIKERQIWRTHNRTRVAIYHKRDDGRFVVGPSGIDPNLAAQFIGTYLVDDCGVHVSRDGRELDADQLAYSLEEYRGFEVDLQNKEGIRVFGQWISDCLKSLKAVSDPKAHDAIEKLRGRVKDICEGYPGCGTINHE